MERKNEQVIIERIANLSKLVTDQHKDNKEEHKAIIARQDKTNGKVKRGELWRHSMVAMGVVITSTVIPLVLYIAWDAKNDIEDCGFKQAITTEAINELVLKVDKID